MKIRFKRILEFEKSSRFFIKHHFIFKKYTQIGFIKKWKMSVAVDKAFFFPCFDIDIINFQKYMEQKFLF